MPRGVKKGTKRGSYSRKNKDTKEKWDERYKIYTDYVEKHGMVHSKLDINNFKSAFMQRKYDIVGKSKGKSDKYIAKKIGEKTSYELSYKQAMSLKKGYEKALKYDSEGNIKSTYEDVSITKFRKGNVDLTKFNDVIDSYKKSLSEQGLSNKEINKRIRVDIFGSPE